MLFDAVEMLNEVRTTAYCVLVGGIDFEVEHTSCIALPYRDSLRTQLTEG